MNTKNDAIRREGSMLVLREKEEESGEYALRMILQNAVPGLLPAQWRAVDGEMSLCFETEGWRPLANELSAGKLGQAGLRRLVNAVAAMLAALPEYLLPTEGLLLDPAHVFTVDLERFAFCFDPFPDRPTGGAYSLARFLLPRLNRKEPDAILLGYDLYQRAAGGAKVREVFREVAEEDEPERMQILQPADEKRPGLLAAEGPDLLPTERAELLDSLFEEEPLREPLRMHLWQQRILIATGLIAAATIVAGAAAGEMAIGAGCSLIAAAVAAFLWLRHGKMENSANERSRDII